MTALSVRQNLITYHVFVLPSFAEASIITWNEIANVSVNFVCFLFIGLYYKSFLLELPVSLLDYIENNIKALLLFSLNAITLLHKKLPFNFASLGSFFLGILKLSFHYYYNVQIHHLNSVCLLT